MRLLNIRTLQLEEFFERDIPRYYILSHRWGKGEVSYKDYVKKRIQDGPGYQKILNACDVARTFEPISGHGKPLSGQPIDWIWIDTCCIDKRSSAELSEAINSMYAWYENAVTCFVYLADVIPSDVDKEKAFASSEWFKRGWTLQELLAPSTIVFFDGVWQVLGHVDHFMLNSLPGDIRQKLLLSHGPKLSQEVSEITGIPKRYVKQFNPSWEPPSVAQRMSWASKRETTRIEDEAYCLLGIFGVNMPLLYGEGRKAFLRLQEEIVKRTTDQSIFAWRTTDELRPGVEDNFGYSFGMLALSPRWFEASGDVVFHSAWREDVQRAFSITNNGLEVKASLRKTSAFISGPDIVQSLDLLGWEKSAYEPLYLLELNCKRGKAWASTRGRRRTDLQDDSLPPVLISLTESASPNPMSSGADRNRFRRMNVRDIGEDVDNIPYERLKERRIYINAQTIII